MTEPSPYVLVVHGGAGNIDPAKLPEPLSVYETGLKTALSEGLGRLEAGESALDAAEAAVRAMEDNSLYNAGVGSVLNADGVVQMDAAVMDGATGGCGCVTDITSTRHPVSLARAVMEQTKHVMLTGSGAQRFGAAQGLERIEPSVLITEARRAQWQRLRDGQQIVRDHDTKGTVGAVALDRGGRLAAATSTGGMANKPVGRVGDSAINGASTWADARVAVSTTGVGERFMRQCTASRLAILMELTGASVEAAAQRVMDELGKDTGGLIAVDRRGNVSVCFNSSGMFRAWGDRNGLREIGTMD